jgi:hypothetical protein
MCPAWPLNRAGAESNEAPRVKGRGDIPDRPACQMQKTRLHLTAPPEVAVCPEAITDLSPGHGPRVHRARKKARTHCRNRCSEIQHFSSTRMRCITAICPAGPPKQILRSLSEMSAKCPRADLGQKLRSVPGGVRDTSLLSRLPTRAFR